MVQELCRQGVDGLLKRDIEDGKNLSDENNCINQVELLNNYEDIKENYYSKEMLDVLSRIKTPES